MGLVETLTGKRIYLDSNIFIYALEDLPPFAEHIHPLFEACQFGSIRPVTSALTVAEVLVKPLRDGHEQKAREFRDFLCDAGVLSLADVTIALLETAARVRAQHGISLPDTVHVATALTAKCEIFLTNDKRLKKPVGRSCIVLDDYISEA